MRRYYLAPQCQHLSYLLWTVVFKQYLAWHCFTIHAYMFHICIFKSELVLFYLAKAHLLIYFGLMKRCKNQSGNSKLFKSFLHCYSEHLKPSSVLVFSPKNDQLFSLEINPIWLLGVKNKIRVHAKNFLLGHHCL